MGSITADVARERERRIWHLRTQELRTHEEIAEILSVDRTTVTKALKRVATRISIDLAKEVQEQKAEQVAQLDKIISLAMREYVRSQEDATKEVTKQKSVAPRPEGDKPKKRDGGGSSLLGFTFDPEDVPGGCYLDEDGEDIEPEVRARKIAEAAVAAATGDMEKAIQLIEEVTTMEVRGRLGDPRYLQTMLSAMKAKRDILGLDAPKPESGTVPMVVKVYNGVDVRDLVRGTATPLPPAAIEATNVEFAEESEDEE